MLSKQAQLMGCRAAAHGREFDGSVERTGDLSSNDLLLRHGTLRPNDRFLWGLVISGPSEYDYEYLGDPTVHTREKVWPLTCGSWGPLLGATMVGSATALLFANSVELAVCFTGGFATALAVSVWRARRWFRALKQGTPLMLKARAAHLEITVRASAFTTSSTSDATEHRQQPSAKVLVSPARLRARKELDQLASEYELVRASTATGRSRRLDAIVGNAKVCAYNLHADDILWLFETGEYAKVVFAVSLASRMRDAKNLDVVLRVIGSPRDKYLQWLALDAACEMVAALDAKLNREQLTELRSAVQGQMADEAQFQITHAEGERWRLCQQLLAATSPVAEEER